jgi:hypothetical protein
LPIIKIMNPHVYVSPMVEETESLKQWLVKYEKFGPPSYST